MAADVRSFAKARIERRDHQIRWTALWLLIVSNLREHCWRWFLSRVRSMCEAALLGREAAALIVIPSSSMKKLMRHLRMLHLHLEMQTMQDWAVAVHLIWLALEPLARSMG